MRLRRLAPLAGASLVCSVLAWYAMRHWRQRQYPFWMAVNPVTDWLYGTRAVLAQLALRPGQRVLEVGPGLGRILLPAAMRVLPGGEVTGIEIDAGIARALRDRAAAHAIANLTVIDGDAAVQSLPDAHFDLAYLVATLGEIADRAATVWRLRDALKPGGLLVIVEGWLDPHRLSREAIARLVEPAGFAAIDVSRAGGRATLTFRRQ